MTSQNLSNEYDFFVENKKELIKKYKNKYIIIQNKSVLDSFFTIDQAINYAKDNKLAPGLFLIQLCEEQTLEPKLFYSRVTFN